MNGQRVLFAFDLLSQEDVDVLSLEMSRTGCANQSYSSNLVPKIVSQQPMGPAFLIYYGPAFLQNINDDSPVRCLGVLAQVYKSARLLWPASPELVDNNVTIRMDILKSLSFAEMIRTLGKGDVFALIKHNEVEAFVECCSRGRMGSLLDEAESFEKLDFGFLLQDERAQLTG